MSSLNGRDRDKEVTIDMLYEAAMTSELMLRGILLRGTKVDLLGGEVNTFNHIIQQ